MNSVSVFIFSLLLSLSLVAQKSNVKGTKEYVNTLKIATDILVNDVTSPVAAARYYAYIALTSYEVQSILDPKKYPSIIEELGVPRIVDIDQSISSQAIIYQAVMFGVLAAAKKLLPSGASLDVQINQLQDGYIKKYKNPTGTIASLALAEMVATQVVTWANSDGFVQLNNLRRYTPKRQAQFWQPTAPSFLAPVEPHWNTIRPMLLQEAAQFAPLPPTPYDESDSSSFYQQLLDVYEVVNRADKSKQDIARFWDCNPFAIRQIGHVEYGLKQLSPGGHWIGITGIACIKRKLNLGDCVLVHALVSVGLHDAFIACWDEKYRSDRVRPETVINKLIDPRWRPLLQTPPFPEYVSGHSVASTYSAVVLTKIFGANFKFVDTTELEFGLPKRKFSSFRQAADEASVSRLYGGIHFQDAIDQGIWLGNQVGEWTTEKLADHFRLLK